MFKQLKEALMKRLNISSPARAMAAVKSTNIGYLKQFEQMGLEEQIPTTFELPFVQKRYDDIVTALRYTKHSKKRERLLKAKRMYEKMHMVEG